MARILVVDDEVDLAWAIQNSLSEEGHDLFLAHDGVQALTLARRYQPDVIILDIVMPRLDGLQVCQRLRRDAALGAVPILFLTVRSSVEGCIEGLDNGADDYMVKPFNLGELKARIRALLRRQRHVPDEDWQPEGRAPLLKMGSLTLNLHTCQLQVGSNSVSLTPAEFNLLYYLMTHPGEVFSSQQLLQQVWGYPPETSDPSLVRWHVKNLREKIEPDPQHPIHVRTVPRYGYMLKAHTPAAEPT